jgi:GAF domain-containing protein
MIKLHLRRTTAMNENLVARQQQLNTAFVTLADTLEQFDDVELLDRLARICVEVLGADSAGVLITDQRGHLRVLASSSEVMHTLELYEIQNEEGPCLDCFRTGRAVTLTQLTDALRRWPRFTHRALAEGFYAVQALPMRLRDQTIGALNLFYAGPIPMSASDIDIAQALADVATIGILQHRAVTRRETLAEQLQTALNSRLAIEQAKGRLAERGGLEIEAAFVVLRDYCRANNLRLSDTAAKVVIGEIDADIILKHVPKSPGAR